jgi:hypothetical protein
VKATAGNALRTGGLVVAGLVPSTKVRAAVLAGSYAAGWIAGPHGIQLISVDDVESENPVVRHGLTAGTSTGSWTLVQLGVLAGLRRLPLPRLLTVPAYAAAMALAEDRVVASFEKARAAAAVRANASSTP